MNLGRSLTPIILAAVSIAADAPGGSRPAPSASFSIRWNRSSPSSVPISVDVLGIGKENAAALSAGPRDPDRWAEIFALMIVPTAGPANDEPLPILGSYRVIENGIRFQPKFPLEPGLRLRARFRPSRLPHPDSGSISKKEITAETTPAEVHPTGPPSAITRVDPASDRLPENLLKFYLHFSQPMARGEAYQRVRLVGEDGKTLERPFLEIGEELWDPTGTRLTLLLDPGRIKRGLRPRLEEGPILLEGKSYTLIVDQEWKDASGRPMSAGFRKSFRAGPADETKPAPQTWRVEAPSAGSQAPLGLYLSEPLDRAMLERVITVHFASGASVPGRAAIDERDQRWRFVPEHPWGPGAYTIDVSNELEDLAGNSIARPFEVDVLGPLEPEARKSPSTSIRFTVPDSGPGKVPTAPGENAASAPSEAKKK